MFSNIPSNFIFPSEKIFFWKRKYFLKNVNISENNIISVELFQVLLLPMITKSAYPLHQIVF